MRNITVIILCCVWALVGAGQIFNTIRAYKVGKGTFPIALVADACWIFTAAMIIWKITGGAQG